MAKSPDVSQEGRSAVEKALNYKAPDPAGYDAPQMRVPPPNPTAAALVDIAQRAQPEPELIGKVPKASKTNGGPLPRETVERGLVHFDQLTAERDRLERELSEARLKISKLELQISDIEATRNTIESRINTCVLQRDEAVREAGELRGALNSVAAICVRYHDSGQD